MPILLINVLAVRVGVGVILLGNLLSSGNIGTQLVNLINRLLNLFLELCCVSSQSFLGLSMPVTHEAKRQVLT